jgi:hypothetical protein
MRANAWEGIGKTLKIKPKFCVSSRDVRIALPCRRTDGREGLTKLTVAFRNWFPRSALKTIIRIWGV